MRSATKKKTGKDPDYLEYIRSLPCCVCLKIEASQTSLTESAHVGPRGLSQKCPDREALPLCHEHHGRDGGQFTQHQMGKRFWGHFDLDRDALIQQFNLRFEAEKCGSICALDVAELSA